MNAVVIGLSDADLAALAHYAAARQGAFDLMLRGHEELAESRSPGEAGSG